jgi:hypothetical protein
MRVISSITSLGEQAPSNLPGRNHKPALSSLDLDGKRPQALLTGVTSSRMFALLAFINSAITLNSA